MLKIAILDDDLFQQKHIEKLVEAYFKEINEYYELRIFSKGSHLINHIHEHGSFDLYLLDVVMPEINGIEVGKQLRNMKDMGFIVYMSLEAGYSLDAFSVRAYHYLLKPIQQEDFFNLMDEICRLFKLNYAKHIFVKTKDSIEKIDLYDINYVELLKRRIYYHLTDDRVIVSTSLHTTFENATREILEDNRFMMCGASYVINLYHISAIREYEIMLRDGSSFKPTKKYIPTIKSQWLEYWLKDS